jgi:YesN/AraC family two-component response regulator
MEWSVYTIIPEFIIAPGYSEKWYEDKSKWLVLEPENLVTLKHKNESHILSSGFYGMGNDLTIINDLTIPVKVKLAVFTKTEYAPSEITKFDIFTNKSNNHLKFMEIFIKEFELSRFDSQVMKDLSHSFSELYESVIQIDRSRNNSTRTMIDPRLIWIHRVIRNQYQEQLTLNILADKLQCNPVYLSNTYSKVFKFSPMKHLQAVRIKKAQQLLVETDLPISEITKSVGYISKSQFASYFKKHVGVTPSEYRRNLILGKGGMNHDSKCE